MSILFQPKFLESVDVVIMHKNFIKFLGDCLFEAFSNKIGPRNEPYETIRFVTPFAISYYVFNGYSLKRPTMYRVIEPDQKKFMDLFSKHARNEDITKNFPTQATFVLSKQNEASIKEREEALINVSLPFDTLLKKYGF